MSYTKFRQWVALKEGTTLAGAPDNQKEVDPKANLDAARALPKVAQAMPGTNVQAAQKVTNIVQSDPKIPVDQAPDIMKAAEKLPQQKVMKKAKKQKK